MIAKKNYSKEIVENQQSIDELGRLVYHSNVKHTVRYRWSIWWCIDHRAVGNGCVNRTLLKSCLHVRLKFNDK